MKITVSIDVLPSAPKQVTDLLVNFSKLVLDIKAIEPDALQSSELMLFADGTEHVFEFDLARRAYILRNISGHDLEFYFLPGGLVRGYCRDWDYEVIRPSFWQAFKEMTSIIQLRQDQAGSVREKASGNEIR
jgi:hypothetical protein